MTTESLGIYNADGRLRGEAYTYVLFCQDSADIYAKIGITKSPLERLAGLQNGCPVTPKLFAYVELRSRRKALDLEAALLKACKAWRQTGEWLLLRNGDQLAFQAVCRAVFAEHREPSFPLKWTRLSPAAVRRAALQRQQFSRHRWSSGSAAFRDFSQDSR